MEGIPVKLERVRFWKDKNGYIRGKAGCIMFWCPQCEFYGYGNYCTICGNATRYATLSDLAAFPYMVVEES